MGTNVLNVLQRVEITMDKFGNPSKAVMYDPRNPDKEIVLDNVISVNSSVRVGEFPRTILELDALPVFIYQTDEGHAVTGESENGVAQT